MPLTHFMERFDPGQKLYIGEVEYKIKWCAWHKGQVRIKLNGIDDPLMVEPLINKTVQADADIRPKLEENEYYTGDLIGLMAIDQNGEEMGLIDEVVSAPAQDILVIGEVLIPAVKKFVTKVDLENGKIHLYIIPGMIPGSDPDDDTPPQPASVHKPNTRFRSNRATNQAQKR